MPPRVTVVVHAEPPLGGGAQKVPMPVHDYACVGVSTEGRLGLGVTS